MQRKVIILGAGKQKNLEISPALVNVYKETKTLDWIMAAFSDIPADFYFVGGYQLEEVAQRYRDINFLLNPNWESTGSIGSLGLVSFESNKNYFLCYGDVLLKPQLVQRLEANYLNKKTDVLIAADSYLGDQFGNTTKNLPHEKVFLKNNKIIDCGYENSGEQTADKNCLFIGLMRLSAKAVQLLHKNFPHDLQSFQLSQLIHFFQKKGLSIDWIEAKDLWIEVDVPKSALNRFILGTKAQTLQILKPLLQQAVIEDQVHFSIAEWRQNKVFLLSQIIKRFPKKQCIVRSSSLSEDGFVTANAGKFLSLLNIDSNPEDLTEAIARVISSYGNSKEEDQVLVQPMIEGVWASGVVFTRTLSYGAPYWVVNYDTQDTAAITSGKSTEDQLYYHWKFAKEIPSNAPLFFSKLREALAEIESLVGFDALDIEFAICKNDKVHILQVRPITSQHLRVVEDAFLDKVLIGAQKRFVELQKPTPFIQGEQALFGIMPDWNPAEIVGVKPKLLAISCYQHLITNSIWATQRAEFGYRDVRPHPLIVCFAGHPYVDVRASINSFFPVGLKDETACKLANFFLKRLEIHPEWHDKLEFEVMPTCYTLDWEQRWVDCLSTEALLTKLEIDAFREGLLKITKGAFEKCMQEYKKIETIDKRFKCIKDSDLKPIDKLWCLFEECKLGTLNFAHLARCGFIASSFLNSAINVGLLSQEEKACFLHSIKTITGKFSCDAKAVKKGKLNREDFIEEYGHLRPGTYELTSPTYRSDPEKYMLGGDIEDSRYTTYEFTKPFTFSEAFIKKIQELYGISESAFRDFMQMAIIGREYSKFIFTKYLSLMLDLIETLGKSMGFNTEEMSHLSLLDILELRNGLQKKWNLKKSWRVKIDESLLDRNIIESLELPPLLRDSFDFFSFFFPKSLPNFIGYKQVTASLIYLQESDQPQPEQLKDKIVLVEKADPGFDWIFNCAIAGLITVYGGPNSHMAIRSSELGIPAAIGVGRVWFEKLQNTQLIELDCRHHILKILQ